MPRLTPTAGSRARAGATLVELIVAMTLLAIVGATLTRVLTKQSQFYRDASETTAVRRELRMGASLLPVEMRSTSSIGGDILEMGEDRLAFRATIGSSIICEKGATSIVLPPTNLSKHTLTTWYAPPQPGDTVFLYNENLLKGAEDDRWEKYGVTAVDNSASCPGAPFADPAADPPSAKPRIRLTLDISAGGPIPDSVKVGAVVRITRPVRYQLFQPSGSQRWYLGYQEHANGSWGSMQPISGPYKPFVSGDGSDSGLQFRYFDTTGVRLPPATTPTRISRIDVFLRAAGGPAAVTERQGSIIRDSVSFRVAVRNHK